MPALDDEIITGMAKLANRELPLKILRAKYKLYDLQTELDGVSQPTGKRRRFFKWILPGVPTDAKRAEGLAGEIEKAKADFIEGWLTPMTVADEQEADAYYFFAHKNLTNNKPDLRDVAALNAWNEAVIFTLNHTMLVKRVECALKRKVTTPQDGERYERLLTNEQARKLDPRILMDIWKIYQAAFIPTESELGKSAAPTPAA